MISYRRNATTALAHFEQLEPRNLLAAVSIVASQDNSLFEDPLGLLSNGAGEFLFSGRTKQAAGRSLRRALIAFDLSEQIPDGATINHVTLSLTLSKAISEDVPFAIHRVTRGWGEGVSDASGPEGKGTDATPPDATWLHGMFPAERWDNPGGDFVTDATATSDVGINNQEYLWSSDQMTSDVEAWRQSPGENFGWIVVGGESVDGTAKRFNSRENSNAASRPTLTVDFTEPQSVELPSASINAPSVTEADGTSASTEFVVTLSSPPSESVTIDYSTADGTAIAGQDYDATSGTLTFQPGDPISKAISVSVLGDDITEGNESFSLRLSDPAGAELSATEATATIVDNDPQPTISVANVSTLEGSGQNPLVQIPVTLSHASAFEISVDFSATPGTSQTDDFVGASGTVTFSPGVTSQSVNLEVVADSQDEPDETIAVDWSNAINADLTDATSSVVIQDDDAVVVINPWQNPDLAMDVTGDGAIVAQDVLVIVNYLNANRSSELPDLGIESPPPFYDVSGDNAISPRDALLIINFINANGASVPAAEPIVVDRIFAFAILDEKEEDADVFG